MKGPAVCNVAEIHKICGTIQSHGEKDRIYSKNGESALRLSSRTRKPLSMPLYEMHLDPIKSRFHGKHGRKSIRFRRMYPSHVIIVDGHGICHEAWLVDVAAGMDGQSPPDSPPFICEVDIHQSLSIHAPCGDQNGLSEAKG